MGVQDLRQSSQSNIGVDLSRSGSYDHAKQLASELPAENYLSLDGERRFSLTVSLFGNWLLISTAISTLY